MAKFLSIEIEDHQRLKQIEDDISDLLLCLVSTLDTIATFEELYDQFCMHRDGFAASRAQGAGFAPTNDAVGFALKERRRETAYLCKKAEALLSKVQNTRTLVCACFDLLISYYSP